eukprot:13890458-Heterocapsa_arctica.AAC.1
MSYPPDQHVDRPATIPKARSHMQGTQWPSPSVVRLVIGPSGEVIVGIALKAIQGRGVNGTPLTRCGSHHS